MGLDRVFRQAVAAAHSVTKSVQESVLHKRWVGQDFLGAALPTSDVTVLAIVNQNVQQVRLADGRIVPTRAQLAFLTPLAAHGAPGRVEPVDPRDVFVLADGTSGTAVSVSGLRQGTPFVLTVNLGG